MAPIRIGSYLFARLKELGIQTVFGVPGDYELALLDLIDQAGLRFSGNPNELIASYAADGYSRLQGVGALVTTFGPGELSAYCGHAGAYTEYVPVVHIVGYPSRAAMKAHTIMHHSLGTGKFDMYLEMAKVISCDAVVLLDPGLAPAHIDRCLKAMLRERRPCYIGVPVDIGYQECEDSALLSKLQRLPYPNDTQLQELVVRSLRSELDKAESPVIVIDGNVARGDVVEQADRLAKITRFPTFVTMMGKGAFDETLPSFGGLYAGSGSSDAVISVLASSDTILWLGPYPSDFNTGEFIEQLKDDQKILFSMEEIQIRSVKFPLKMRYVLEALNESLQASPLSKPPLEISWSPYGTIQRTNDTVLKQDALWQRFAKFLRPRDFLITETGTSAFGVGTARLPAGASMFSQVVFGSIGFATGAAVGAFKAIKESGKYDRCILVTGEGSLHLTVQACMDMLKLRLNPIVIVLNNDGYTIERLIHGPQAEYNKLQQLDYSLLAKTFGPEHPSKYWGPVQTEAEWEAVLMDTDFSDGAFFRLVELKLGALDAPSWVLKMAAGVEAFNKQSSQS